MQVVGHFGSAGSSRSLRKTRLGTGVVVNTSTARRLSESRNTVDSTFVEPSVDEIRAAIESQQCCWCDDPRTFLMLGQHLARIHGIDLQEIRDLLLLPKSFGFSSPETRARFQDRSRRNWPNVAEKMAETRAKVHTRDLSAYGRSVQKSRAQKAVRTRFGPTGYTPRVCVICGVQFRSRHKTQTCQKAECRAAIYSRALKGRPNTWTKPGRVTAANVASRRILNCAACGKEFWSGESGARRLTCSPECMKKNRSDKAKARDLTAMREAQARAAASKPVRLCSVPDCGRKHHVHGYCSMHAQRLKLA